MNRISVNGSTKYDILIKPGALNGLGQLLNDEVGGSRVLIVSDANVAKLYLGTVSTSCSSAGYDVHYLELPPGDASKSLDSYSQILNYLSEREFERSDLLIALGGGMIGDLVGFAAASFKRGMRYVQVPTSLLAAVDSSVGGKTAINLAGAKNQVGAFYNPSLVVCDPETIATLPQSAFYEGCAEIVKYGILSGPDIIKALERTIAFRKGEDLSRVIELAVSIKRDVVEMDETDESFRQYLNLGHLVGHAIEACSDYSIPHGYAVAQGLAIEARACAVLGLTSFSTYFEIVGLLEKFGFDLSGSYDADDLLPYMLKDKRLRDGCINIIVPIRVGECIMKPMPSAELRQFLSSGL